MQHKLYELGFNLIQITRDTKKPYSEWKKWQTDRLPLEALDHQNEYRTDANWAVLMGDRPWIPDSGFITIEADDRAALDLLKARCPDTPVKQHSARGEHWIYRKPDYHVGCRNKIWVDKKKYALDLKADGGYIAAPGSKHASGFVYKEVTPWTAELLRSAPVYDPKWLGLDQVAAPDFGDLDHDAAIDSVMCPIGERVKQFKEHLLKCGGAQKGRGADNYCLALARSGLWDFALPEEWVADLLHDWGQRDDQLDDHGGYYPWTEHEIRHKVQAARLTPPDNRPGNKLRGWDYRAGEQVCEKIKYQEQHQEQPEQEGNWLWRWDDLCAMSDKVIYVVDKLLEVGGLNLLCAVSYSGKTTLLGGLVAPLIEGGTFFGYQCLQSPVLYIGTDRNRITRIRDQIARHYTKGEESHKLAQELFYCYKYDHLPELLSVTNIHNSVEAIRRISGRKEPALVIVDTFRSAFMGKSEKGDEVDTAVMQQHLQPLQKYARDSGNTLQVFHHAPKYMGDYAGAGSVPNLTDSMWSYKRDPNSNKADLRIQTRDDLINFKVYLDPDTKILTAVQGFEDTELEVAIADLFGSSGAMVSDVQTSFNGCKRKKFYEIVNVLADPARKLLPRLNTVKPAAGNRGAVYTVAK